MADIKLVPYVDGYFAFEREITLNPSPKFPFLTNPTPDVYTRAYERFFRVLAAGYIPKVAERNTWQNLLTYSEDLTQAAWTKTNATITADASTAPDGNATMDKILESSATGEHSIAQGATVTNAQTEVSVFAAAAGRSFVKVQFTDSAAAVFSAVFDVNAGVASSPTDGVSARLTPMGNSQFRCAITFTPAAGAGTMKAILGSEASTFSYAGDTSKGANVWGAQVLATISGKPAPYVSTTSATRTVLAPPVDPMDPLAYLVVEDEPVLENSTTATVRRLYFRIPREQVVPSSLFVTKPDIPGTFPQIFGAYLITKPVASVSSYDGYQTQNVLSDSGKPAVITLPTGGTFTLTCGANTTGALAYNVDAATLQSALNGLASVTARGGVTVSGSQSAGFSITFAGYSAITVDASNLTCSGAGNPTANVSSFLSGSQQSIAAAALRTSASVGMVGTSSFTPSGANPMFYSPDQNGGIIFGGPTISGGLQATGGTFTITVLGQTTSAVAFTESYSSFTNETKTSLQSALNALSNVAAAGGATAVSSTTSYGGAYPIQITIGAPQITGGTYTLTYGGQTTSALAYNADAATIAAALNALSSITAIGSVTVLGGLSSGRLNITVNFPTIPTISTNAASLTPAGSSATIAVSNSSTAATGAIQTLTFAVGAQRPGLRTLYVPGHGLSNGDTIILNNSTLGYLYPYTVGTAPIAIVDGNTLSIDPTGGSLYSTTGSFAQIGKRTFNGYAPTARQTRVKYVTDFYLPGVSPAITTIDDIPLPTYQGDPASLLTAIFSGASSINYQVGELKPWNGAIVQRQLTTLNASKL